MIQMKGKFVTIILALSLVSVLVLSGCNSTPITPDPIDDVEFKETQKFENYEELLAAFQEQGGGYARGFGFDVLESVTAIGAIAESAVAGDGAAKSAPDFSTTNVQVEGVDEADIVKSDGEYIYNFSNNKLIITKAYPIESSKIVSKTELKGVRPIEMFVKDDKLLLFGTKSLEAYLLEEKKVAPSTKPATSASPTIVNDGFYPYYYSQTVTVQLYDISDRSNPKLEKETGFEGNYKTSRLIGNQAYFVINTWPRYNYYRGGIGPIPLINDVIEIVEIGVTEVIETVIGEEKKETTAPIKPEPEEQDIIPVIIENGVAKRIAEPEEISFIPPMPIQSFVTIGSINLETGKLEKEVIAGNADSVFASEKNIYLSSTAWLPPETPIIGDAERFVNGDSQKTVINKFGLKNGEVGFLGQGQVPGTVLNQFSMDEYKGNFRIATTINQFGREQQTNNLYVLDEDMETIGTLEDLAPGESIFSVRFMGNRAYMVTFKKVDPLFVIDVSNPKEPKVLGKLKIPGFSDYLHPIDENHIIGVGKDAVASKTGDFAWYQGMKIAVFDVSDVENPIEKHLIIIGDRGTTSYALSNHKAFLYDKEKELLVLPIQLHEISDEEKAIDRPNNWPAYGEPVFQGAFVYKLTIEDGFEERGRITHITEEEELKRGYYYGFDYTVQRALYIGDVLYTLSNKMLKANDLDSLEELKVFEFNEK